MDWPISFVLFDAMIATAFAAYAFGDQARKAFAGGTATLIRCSATFVMLILLALIYGSFHPISVVWDMVYGDNHPGYQLLALGMWFPLIFLSSVQGAKLKL